MIFDALKEKFSDAHFVGAARSDEFFRKLDQYWENLKGAATLGGSLNFIL